MMFRFCFFLTLLTLCCCRQAYCQHHFIKTDLAGMALHHLVRGPVGDIYGPRYSLGYEHGFKNSRWSVSVLLNHGFTNSYSTSSNMVMMNYGVSRSGNFAFIEARYYPLANIIAGEGARANTHKGFFIAPYCGLFKVKEREYLFPLREETPIQPVMRYEQDVEQIGLGALVGYKQVILKHFFVEGLVGAGKGWNRITSTTRSHYNEDPATRYLDVWRMEINTGLCF